MQFYHYQITEHLEENEQENMDIFLSIFFHKQALYRFNYRKDFNGVYFSYLELRNISGFRNYKAMVQMAIDIGLELHNVKSKYGKQLYYFKPINEQLDRTPRNISPTKSKNLREARKVKKQNLSPEAKIALSNLHYLEFTCTEEEYKELMESGYDLYVSKKKAVGKKPQNLKGYLSDVMDYWSRLEEFKKARGYDYLDYIWEDTFGNRLHSILTCCPSKLKESGYIKLNGQPVECLDLAQSQPTLLFISFENHTTISFQKHTTLIQG